MDYELLGANIRKYRVNLGMKQEELAEKVESVSYTHLTLAAICDVLKCQPGDILEYSPEEKNN